MKQQNFFRQFAEKITGATPPPPDTGDQDWQALSDRLDRHDQLRRSLPVRWLAGLTVLLFLTNGFWFWQWRQANLARQAEAKTASPGGSASVVKRDTVFHKTTVYQYDTIYRTAVVQRREVAQGQIFSKKTRAGGGLRPAENAPGQLLSEAGQPGENLRASSNLQPPNPLENAPPAAQNAVETSAAPPQNAVETSASSPQTGLENAAASSPQKLPGTSIPSSQTGLENAAASPQNLPETSSVPSIAKGEKLPSTLPSPGLKTFDLPVWKKRSPPSIAVAVLPVKKRRPVARQFIPRSIGAGFDGGVYLPLSQNFESKNGYRAGVSCEIGFANPLSLSLGFAHARVNFKGDKYDSTLGLPPLQPPGDDYILKYFETHDGGIPSWQASAGFRYRLAAGNRFFALLGAGYLAQWRGEHEFEMEYVHLPSGMEFSSETEMPASGSPTSYARFEVGAGWQFFEKWQVRAGLGFDVKIEREQAGVPRYLGLGVAVLRDF